MSFSRFCYKFDSKILILGSLIAYIFASYVLNLLTYPITFGDIVSVELSFEPQKAVDFYSQWKDAGILSNYVNGLFWDYPYMMAYGFLLLSLVSVLLCRMPTLSTKFKGFVFFTPIVAVGFDFLENAIEFVILGSENFNYSLIYISAYISAIKWLAVLFAIFEIILLSVMFFVNFLRSRNNKNY